ncbi:MAG TPA: hypothetical protein VKA84_18120 [Gemmatimonadaceae bacterium]|nr:hypothetical protein [Gemmatimonadaceae bacterium]
MRLGSLAALALTLALAACNESRDEAAAVSAPRAQVAAGAAAPAVTGRPNLRCPPTFPTLREVAAGTEGDLNRNGTMCVGRLGPQGREQRVDDLVP